MRILSIAVIALATFFTTIPTSSDALSVHFGDRGISVGTDWGWGGGGYYDPGYVQPSCYYDYYGRLVCPRTWSAPPPVIVVPKKKWKKKWKHHPKW